MQLPDDLQLEILSELGCADLHKLQLNNITLEYIAMHKVLRKFPGNIKPENKTYRQFYRELSVGEALIEEFPVRIYITEDISYRRVGVAKTNFYHPYNKEPYMVKNYGVRGAVMVKDVLYLITSSSLIIVTDGADDVTVKLTTGSFDNFIVCNDKVYVVTVEEDGYSDIYIVQHNELSLIEHLRNIENIIAYKDDRLLLLRYAYNHIDVSIADKDLHILEDLTVEVPHSDAIVYTDGHLFYIDMNNMLKCYDMDVPAIEAISLKAWRDCLIVEQPDSVGIYKSYLTQPFISVKLREEEDIDVHINLIGDSLYIRDVNDAGEDEMHVWHLDPAWLDVLC